MQGCAGRGRRQPPSHPNRSHFDADSIDSAIAMPWRDRVSATDRPKGLNARTISHTSGSTRARVRACCRYGRGAGPLARLGSRTEFFDVGKKCDVLPTSVNGRLQPRRGEIAHGAGAFHTPMVDSY
jgi:hypothetical protein